MQKTITGMTFDQGNIRLDGKFFVDCSFDNCILWYGATDSFGFYNCRLGAGVRIEFDKHASTMLTALSLFYGSGLTDFVENLFSRIRQMSTTLPGKKPN